MISIRPIFKSQYFKNFSALASSEVIAQIIQIGISPILTRVYSPIVFGQYELFKSTAMILLVVAFMQFDLSIYTDKNHISKINLVALNIIIISFFCIFLCIGLYNFSSIFQILLNLKSSNSWYWALPMYVYFSGLTNLFLIILTKSGSFFLLSKIKITVSILVAISQLFFGYLSLGFWGLVYSSILVQIIAFFICLLPFILKRKNYFAKFSLIEIKKCLIENWRLPLLVLPGNFLNNLVQTMPVFFLGKIDSNALGYFALARRIIDFPLKFISGAVQKLYVKELTDEISATGFGEKTFKKNLKIYSFISIVLFLGILILTKPLLPVLFGKEWEGAVNYVILFGFLFSIRFVFGGLSFIMVIGKSPKYDLYWQISFALIIFVTFYLVDFFKISALISIIFYVAVSSLAYFSYGILCKHVSKSKNLLNNN